MAEARVLLGASDWSLPHWQASFYPADMPEDWRLAYFNTQFSCVWLPHTVWSVISPSEAAGWLDDTRGEFRFVLEAGVPERPGERGLLAMLGPKLGRHCTADHPDLVWFDAGTDLRRLSETLRQRMASAGVTYLLSKDGNMAMVDRVGTLLELLGLGSGDRVG
jgi:hypothetical protein